MNHPFSGTAAPSEDSRRHPGSPAGDQGAEAAALPGRVVSAPADEEFDPWYRRPRGPYFAADLPTAKRVEREHVMDQRAPLACAGPHTGTVPHPCPCVQWATRVRLAARRGQLLDGPARRAVGVR